MLKKETLIRIIFVAIGCFLTAISINMFLIPHKLAGGGVSGIALIIEYLTGIPTGYLFFILNIPIFLFGIKEIDKDFIIFSLIGTIALSVSLVITKDVGTYFKVKDVLLSCIYGGVIAGSGIGMVLKYRASQGGSDIIAVILKKKTGLSFATLTLYMNVAIVLVGASISGIDIALYTIISMYVTSVVLDRVIEGFDRKKMLFIITCKEEEVSSALMKQIGRGVTFFYGEGGYTGEKKNIIYCIVTSLQLARAKKAIEDIDPSAFISIVEAAEVQGKGFKRSAI